MYNDELIKQACNQLDASIAKSKKELLKAYKAITSDDRLTDDDRHILYVIYYNLLKDFDGYKKFINGGV